MFVTKNQFYVFVACISFGTIAGFVFCLLKSLNFFIQNRWVVHILDACYLTCFAFLFSYLSYLLLFPNFRPYMLVGFFIGFLGYLKSIHILLAKIKKKFYNICIKILRKEKKKENVTIKNKKNDSCFNGGRCVAIGNSIVNNDLPNDSN